MERCSALLKSGTRLDKSIRLGLRWMLAYISFELPNLQRRIEEDVAEQMQIEARERESRRERVRRLREERERLTSHVLVDPDSTVIGTGDGEEIKNEEPKAKEKEIKIGEKDTVIVEGSTDGFNNTSTNIDDPKNNHAPTPNVYLSSISEGGSIEVYLNIYLIF
ncbi:unnamed protein product [Protopolystoma xenopodis]|uniref:Uncharacterized protein n=1 Tax=Protopolystoma xenopodis TaxID=117903 RepID=A0A3S5FG19_9PLAT|nr:unnamed protein product [Protopolystoma xenopodis]